MGGITWKPAWLSLLAAGVLAAPVLSIAPALAVEPQPDPAPSSPATRNGAEAELLVLGQEKLVRVRIQIEIGGRPATRVWGETFDWLMARTDRNDNGRLEAEEVAALPSPFNLRQALWGHWMPCGLGPKLEALDTDRDGRVDRSELGGFYGQTGLGSALVAVGQAPLTEALTDALLERLDANNDREISEPEWRAAYETLEKLDSNDDEMIGPGELLAKASYPGVLPSLLVTPPAGEKLTRKEQEQAQFQKALSPGNLPFFLLPRRRANVHWVAALLERRDADRDGKLDPKESGLAAHFARLDVDKDGKLSAEELAGWRSLPADVRWSIRLDKDGKPLAGNLPLLVDAGMVRLELRAEGGKLAEEAAAARKRLLSQFAEADADRDSRISAEDAKAGNLAELRSLIEREDRDGDKKLSEKELTAWLDFQGQLAAGHVMVSVLDFGSGLFEFLDADHNGALGGRELRAAWDRLKSARCLADGRLQRQALPRHVIGAVSHGRAEAEPQRHRAGPAWFLSMDRNADGELSAREFLGPPLDFRKMDRDGDGFVSAEEAAAAAAPPKPSGS